MVYWVPAYYSDGPLFRMSAIVGLGLGLGQCMFGIADLRYSIPESSIVKIWPNAIFLFCNNSHNNNYNKNKNNTVLSCLNL